MKIAVEHEKVVTVSLTEPEARLLSALADFPDWDAQEPPVAAFLSTLHEELADAGYRLSPDLTGFTDNTNL